MFDRPLSRRDMPSAAARPPSPRPRSPTWLPAKDDDPFGGFTVGVQSYTFRKFNLEQAVAKIAAGSASSTPSSSAATSRSTARRSRSRRPEALQGLRRHADRLRRRAVHARTTTRTRSVFDFGSRPRRQVPQRRPDAGQLRQPRQAVRRVQDRHRHPPARPVRAREPPPLVDSAEVILKAVKDHHELIGTCLDTGHLIRMAQLGEKLDPAQQVQGDGQAQLRHAPEGPRQQAEDRRDLRRGRRRARRAGRAQGAQGREVQRATSAIEYEAKPDEPIGRREAAAWRSSRSRRRSSAEAAVADSGYPARGRGGPLPRPDVSEGPAMTPEEIADARQRRYNGTVTWLQQAALRPDGHAGAAGLPPPAAPGRASTARSAWATGSRGSRAARTRT